MNEHPVVIRSMEPGEETAVCCLVRRVFAEFVAPLYAEQGIQEFERYTSPDLLAQRIQINHFVLVAEARAELIGAIEVRDCNHIALLFVTPEWQGQGVARKLLQQALAMAKGRKPDLTVVNVHASPNAVDVYKALGFEVTGVEHLDHGIRFMPMRMTRD